MTLKHLLAAVVLALPPAGAAGLAVASASDRSEASVAASATARYHDIERATADGYAEFPDAAGIRCIASAEGAMGIHYVKGELVGDPAIDPTRPEALVYEQRPNGTLKLVALEYIVLKAAWDAIHAQPPALFGRTFDTTPAPNRYGIPAFYALHAWIWKPNPSGLLAPYNPRVEC